MHPLYHPAIHTSSLLNCSFNFDSEPMEVESTRESDDVGTCKPRSEAHLRRLGSSMPQHPLAFTQTPSPIRLERSGMGDRHSSTQKNSSYCCYAHITPRPRHSIAWRSVFSIGTRVLARVYSILSRRNIEAQSNNLSITSRRTCSFRLSRCASLSACLWHSSSLSQFWAGRQALAPMTQQQHQILLAMLLHHPRGHIRTMDRRERWIIQTRAHIEAWVLRVPRWAQPTPQTAPPPNQAVRPPLLYWWAAKEPHLP